MEQLFVFCDFYWSCAHSDWIMSSVDNVTIICDGSCHRSDYQMNNVPYAQILCKGDVTNPSRLYETCDQVVINAEQNTQLDVLCEYDRACDDISVCSDGILNLDCIGNNTASFYPNYPDRLAIFTENSRLRDAMGCDLNNQERAAPSSAQQDCGI